MFKILKCYHCRRQMVENLRKMQELRAQIQAQLKLADTLKKLNENAGEDQPYGMVCYGKLWLCMVWCDLIWYIQTHLKVLATITLGNTYNVYKHKFKVVVTLHCLLRVIFLNLFYSARKTHRCMTR